MAIPSIVDVDTVVVGGGPIAAAAAWYLAADGRPVLLLPSTGGATPGPVDLAVPSRPGRSAVGLALASEPWWREVESETGAALLFLSGSIDHGDAVALAMTAEALSERGLPYTWLSPQEARRRWPGCVFDGPVLHQPDRTGWLRAGQAEQALRAALVGRGGTVDSGARVERVEPRDAGATVSTGVGRIRARRVVVAAGAESARLVGGRAVGRLRAYPECVAGFPLRVVDPCVASPDRWPVATRHVHRDGRRPMRVHVTPDPCGDVLVGMSGAQMSEARRGRSLEALQEHVAAHLPGLDPSHPRMVPSRRVESGDGRAVLLSDGAVTIGAGFAESGSAFAPAFGRALADLARTGPGAMAASGGGQLENRFSHNGRG